MTHGYKRHGTTDLFTALNVQPCVWHKAAAEIIEKVRRGRTALQKTGPSSA